MPFALPWSLALILRKVGFKRSDKFHDVRGKQPCPPSALLRLPPELVFEIAAHLSDPSDIISLSSTSAALRQLICEPRGLVFRFNLRHNGWDEAAVARKAAFSSLTDLNELQSGKKRKKKDIGNKVWLVLARSAFHKSSAAATVLGTLPVLGTDVKRRARQKRGRAFIRKVGAMIFS